MEHSGSEGDSDESPDVGMEVLHVLKTWWTESAALAAE